jgi:hypothetical protein
LNPAKWLNDFPHAHSWQNEWSMDTGRLGIEDEAYAKLDGMPRTVDGELRQRENENSQPQCG